MKKTRRRFLKQVAAASAAATFSDLLTAPASAQRAAPYTLPPTDFAGKLTGTAPAPDQPLTLWYRRPARQWVEALPVGNGRLAAMVFGGIVNERIQLNEDTLWAGGPYDPDNPDALAALPEVRKLIFAGNYREANRLVGQKMMAKPLRQMPYQTVGDLLLTFPPTDAAADYRRELDLDTAITTVSYGVNGTRFTRQVFSSPVDQVIAVRLTADKPAGISFTATLRTPQRATLTTEAPDTLLLAGVNGAAEGIAPALKFQSRVKVIATGGTTATRPSGIAVTSADSVLILIVAATSYRSFNDVSGDPDSLTRTALAAAAARSYDTLLQAHIAGHQRLFRRVSLDLGAATTADQPTDERIRSAEESDDPQLAGLYFQFGRYLLISSSRPGSQPANLQGLWNESMSPPWGGKYTININTEMNYWPAEPTNLAECTAPLVAMVKDLTHTGARTAKVQWGAGGWVTHHNTDLWRASAPIDGPAWGMWPTGGAWLCKHLFDHYEYSGDRQFLAEIYPVLKGAAQFFLDTLIEEPTHKWLVTCPSLSPEHQHPGGAAVCAGPTMDQQIIRDLFTNCIAGAETLGLDEDFRKTLGATRARLAPDQIGKAGQLREWLEDWDMEAPDIHHRHVSHLYALFPSDQITLRGTPKLAAAARKSLEIRGDNATGWGLAWRISLWARLQEGDHAHRVLGMLLKPGRTYPNMFDSCPPFQIDGNFGGTAGITEMLLQSLAGEILFLPALPGAWPTGSVRGLRARGGFEVDIAWRDGKLLTATIRSLLGSPAAIRYGERSIQLKTQKGDQIVLDSGLNRQ